MQAGQVGLHCGFVNKDNAVWHPRDGGHAMLEPIAALLPYLGATTLARDQRLFLYVNPSRDSRLAMEE